MNIEAYICFFSKLREISLEQIVLLSWKKRK